jgi:diadenosine tetraphosphate (Ap4A) HIT family hydrolase
MVENMYRSRKTSLRYDHSNPEGCPFCNVIQNKWTVISQTDDFFVVKNHYPYSWWDINKVVEHLLVIPKLHVISLSEMNPAKLTELMKIYASYEKEGFNVYTRAPSNIEKSVKHQHTHLIRTDNKERSLAFYLRKPLIVFYK